MRGSPAGVLGFNKRQERSVEEDAIGGHWLDVDWTPEGVTADRAGTGVMWR